MKYKLEYVISGCQRLQVFHGDMFDDPDVWSTYQPLVQKIPLIVRRDLQEYSKHSDPILSLLFNAFVEKRFARPTKGLQIYNWLESEKVYADSGGLQMVTTGKTVTPEIKKQIYATQTYADYAMCFDVIPLTSTTTIQTSTERLNTANKIFEDHLFADSAQKTAQNIKDQIAFFRENNAKTKVIIIVQGNTPQDMKFFFDIIASKLTEEDYAHVCGIAVADTCMGNGELESIKMLHAAHLIAQDCHPAVASHVHFLGVGSLHRLRPIIYLVRSGFLKSFERISYDSTSHTSSYDLGTVKLDNTQQKIGTHRTPLATEVFNNIYTYFSDVFSPLVSHEEYTQMVFGKDGNSNLKYTSLRDNSVKMGGNAKIAGMLIKQAYIYYQIQNFMKRAEDMWSEPNNYTPIGHLLNIKDEADILRWYNNFSMHVSSKSIRRRSAFASLSLLD
jgi:hypothetical protein